MADALITLIVAGPVVVALLAAVAPARAEALRPILLPAVVAELTLAALLGLRGILRGFLLSGAEPGRPLGADEIADLMRTTTGLGLPVDPAAAGALVAVVALVAFARVGGWREALPWLPLAAACALVSRARGLHLALYDRAPIGGALPPETVLDTVRSEQILQLLAGSALLLFVAAWLAVAEGVLGPRHAARIGSDEAANTPPAGPEARS